MRWIGTFKSNNRGRCASAVAFALLLLAGQGSAVAAPKNRIEGSYVVEVGHIPILKMSFDAALTGQSYESSATVKTKGVAGLFSDYQMDLTASGAVSGTRARPAQFTSRAEKKDQSKTLSLSWQDGKPPTVEPSPDVDDQKFLAGSLTASLIDPLSMVVRMTALQADRPCQSVERVFDGKEVYDLRFELEGKVALGSSAQGSYRGEAYKCRVTYVPVAGRPAAKFKKKGLTPPSFDIWLAPAGGEGNLFVPVLATGKLKGFSFIAYADKTTIDGIPLASAN